LALPHPTAEWIANQITQACGWKQTPRDLIRDRDGAYGEVFIFEEFDPWGLDHVVVFGERHLRHVETRTHLSLDKDAPLSRTVQRAGRILRLPILGGLHHLWGAPRIHGELLKLGIEIGQTSVAKYMARRRGRHPRVEDVPPQSCRRHRGDGSVRRTDDLILLALWLVNHGAWSTTGFMVWRYRASDRRMDRKSDHASVR
jgi:hypothetical protein